MVNSADVGREGRRWYAFYLGYRAQQAGGGECPYAPGTDDHACWKKGWQYAAGEDERCP